jgi:hypothetical protein
MRALFKCHYGKYIKENLLRIFQGDKELRTWVIVIATVLVTSALTTLAIYAIVPSLFGLSRVETLRFYKPEVQSGNQVGYVPLDLGTWSPKNPTNNAVVNAIFYFQYLTPNDTSKIRFGLSVGVNGTVTDMTPASSSRTEYSQSKVYVCSLPNPNSPSYDIQLWFHNHDTTDTGNPPVPIPVYIKEINVILQVADGLTSS